MSFHSGLVCLVGRPNTGKSTLTNALVGEKVAITSNRPQTTRSVIQGIVHREHGQIVLVDTPGIHRPRTLLGEKLNELVRSTYADVDVIAMCIPADSPIGPGDKMIVEEIAAMRRIPKVAIITKVDKVNRQKLAEKLMEVQALDVDWTHIVPVSALKADNTERLVDVLLQVLPEGPAYFPAEVQTDAEQQSRISELIREAAINLLREELPHSVAVTVDEMEVKGKSVAIYASLYVERESQKPIIIGKGGAQLKQIGMTARADIEKLLGAKVMLDLRVKVAADWQRDPKQMGKLGFDF